MIQTAVFQQGGEHAACIGRLQQSAGKEQQQGHGAGAAVSRIILASAVIKSKRYEILPAAAPLFTPIFSSNDDMTPFRCSAAEGACAGSEAFPPIEYSGCRIVRATLCRGTASRSRKGRRAGAGRRPASAPMGLTCSSTPLNCRIRNLTYYRDIIFK